MEVKPTGNLIATTLLAAGVTVLSGCQGPAVPPEGVPDLFAAIEASPAVHESALDGCVVLHHVWKLQVRAVHQTAQNGVRARVRMLVDSAYAPFASFWDGYVGSGFERWARREFDLAGDPRSPIPTRVDLLDLIAGVTSNIERLTGRRGCADWYLVYGPGWANLGGLSSGEMLIDFFGLPRAGGLENLRRTVPHEVAHVIHGERPDDPDRGTLLSSIISEGLASYFGDLYWGDDMSPAEALGYDQTEWQWALGHEGELWSLASGSLASREREVIERYRRADTRLVPEGPPKVGYFLGYRIVEAYVRRHGASSLQDVFHLPTRQVLERSGYAG